uniref:Uncharacterized protein n=1 Tax=Chenopodium quinoa TaxID=63459 RepID=A0A803NCP1_CHEQI
MHINESFYVERNSTLPRRLRSNQGDYIQCYQQQECSRIVVPIDHGRSRSFGSRSQHLVEDSEYPGTFHTNYSMTVMRPINARPSVISVRDYMEEDVHPDQPLARSDFLHRGEYPGDPSYISYHPDEEMVLDQQSLRSHVPERSRYDSPSYEVVVPDQPISRSSYPERRGGYSNTLVPDQPISQSSNHERRGRYSDSLVLDQPISRSNYPGKRRRYYDSPSSYDRTGKDVAPYSRSNFHERRRFSENSRSYSRYRRESTKYEDPYEEARRPRKYKEGIMNIMQSIGRAQKNVTYVVKIDHQTCVVESLLQTDLFKKPMINSAKFGGTPEKQARHTNSRTAPASVSDSPKVLETKFSKDNEEVDSTNKLAAKLSKDNAESNLTKKPETMPVNDNAGTDLSKKLVTKSSRDDAEANLTKKLETKSSKDNAGTNLTKKLETIASKDNAEANATKELAARPSKDDAEANATKELATKLSKDDAKVNVTKDLAKKSFNDNAEAKVTKKPATNPSLGNAEAKLTKDLGTKLSNDNAEANLTKELGMKLSKDNAEGNLTKELGMKLSEDNAEGNLTKELGMKLSEDNAEANLTKELGTKLSQDNSEANLTRKLEPKPSNSDKKEVEREKKNSGKLKLFSKEGEKVSLVNVT